MYSASPRTRRRGHADNYMVLGYMVPEQFLYEEGYRILCHDGEAMHRPHKLFTQYLQPTEEAINQARRVIDSVRQCGRITREIIVGLGAWHIMAMAGLLDFVILTPMQGHSMQPSLLNVNTPRPRAVSFDPRDGQLIFDLHTGCGKLALVRTAGCDDQLGVGPVEYAIALTSTHLADGLPLQDPMDDIVPSLALPIHSLQCVLDTENLPTWYPAVRDHRKVHGLPLIPSLKPVPQTLGDSVSRPTQRKRVLVAKRESERKELRLVY